MVEIFLIKQIEEVSLTSTSQLKQGIHTLLRQIATAIVDIPKKCQGGPQKSKALPASSLKALRTLPSRRLLTAPSL